MATPALTPPTPTSPAPASATRACAHCGLPVVGGGAFCCRGCEEVHRLLVDAGLERYYALGGAEGQPATSAGEQAAARVDHKWLEPIAAKVADATGLSRVTLDVQGVHCAACVWLFEQTFSREPGAASIVVNPAVGAVELTVASDFPLATWIERVEAFGYRFGLPLKAAADRARGSSDVVWRMGVCIAIAMNTMIFAIAVYAGLDHGPIYRVFHGLDFGLSFVSVAVGGSVFFRSAWQAVRQRVLHLDLPIALGILLAFASSAYTYVVRGGATSYFDTLNVFIALMLVGRFLQERVLAKNRALLLASDGEAGLYTRRVSGGAAELVRCVEIAEGDTLLVAHQDLVPVDAVLLGDRPALFSLDWINGESAPRTFAPGDVVPAGAFCQDARAATLRATAAFDASTIVPLLRTSTKRDDELARSSPWWKRLSTAYVAIVLVLGAAGAIGWYAATRDVARTLDVVAAVLIVTCPCAFGIAAPLAYELAQAGLRRAGLFVRTPGFLDRAARVERVVFDKTGTLTTGALVVANPAALESLPADSRAIAYDLAARSSHPKSRAVADALARLGATLTPSRVVREVPGKGVELAEGGEVYRLGAPGWAGLTEAGAGDVVFGEGGRALAAIRTTEELRPDAKDDVAALARDGYAPYVLSGDSAAATRAMAEACGIPEDHAFGGRAPEAKAAWLRSVASSPALFVGDGINDSLAADAALCAGTPAIDRPFMASRCDFYFTTPGLRPIRLALATAKRLARVVRTNLAVAVFYNAITVTLALAGMMTPLLSAVLMPLSSLSTVLATTAQLGARSRSAWRS